MKKSLSQILIIDSLRIGYTRGKQENILLPPLNASAMKGELIAVIGKNGIGKSTLLRTLSGLQPSLGGNILYSERNIEHYSRMELAQKVGYISTETVKVSNMSVYDLVSMGRFPHTDWTGRIDTPNHEAILDAMERTGVKSLSWRLVSELSDGERQRAMISRLLAQDTDIMIMDEPTAFLDIGNKYEILHLMHSLSQKSEKTIIFSTHDLHMAISHSDKIWLILNDQLIEGSPEDLLIEGAFDHIFDSSPVQFNSEQGTFSFRNDEHGSIYIDGEGVMRHWTEKAVNRSGFSVSLLPTDPYITVPSGQNRFWKLIYRNSTIEAGSIYDLVHHLENEMISPL